jgi:hypothetical protein
MGRAHEMAPSRQTVGGPAVALHIAERVPIASLSDSASGRICCCAATGGCGTRFGPRGRFLYAVPAGRSTQSAYKKHHTGGGRSEAHTTSSPTGYRGPLSASAPPPARSSGAMGCWIGPDISPRLAAFTVMFGPAVYQGDFFGGGPDVRGGRRPCPERRGHDQGRDSRERPLRLGPRFRPGSPRSGRRLRRLRPPSAPAPSAPAPSTASGAVLENLTTPGRLGVVASHRRGLAARWRRRPRDIRRCGGRGSWRARRKP